MTSSTKYLQQYLKTELLSDTLSSSSKPNSYATHYNTGMFISTIFDIIITIEWLGQAIEVEEKIKGNTCNAYLNNIIIAINIQLTNLFHPL
jgi:hypothetical protein